MNDNLTISITINSEWSLLRRGDDYRYRFHYCGRFLGGEHTHALEYPPVKSMYAFDDGCVVEFQKWGSVE